MAGYYNIKLNFENIPKKYNHFSWIESIGKIVPYQIENTEYCCILTIYNFIKQSYSKKMMKRPFIPQALKVFVMGKYILRLVKSAGNINII